MGQCIALQGFNIAGSSEGGCTEVDLLLLECTDSVLIVPG